MQTIEFADTEYSYGCCLSRTEADMLIEKQLMVRHNSAVAKGHQEGYREVAARNHRQRRSVQDIPGQEESTFSCLC
jgi:hypothetical protein